MIKKQIALALGAALAFGGASVAQAGVYTSTANFSGAFSITGFADSNPNSFRISLSNLNGLLDLNVPHSGIISAERKGVVAIDYIPQHAGPELVSNVPNFIPLGSADITTSGITGSHFIYNFTTNTFSSNSTPVLGGSFGGSTNGLNLLLGNLFGSLGGAIGDGSVVVNHVFGGTAGHGTWTIDVTETDHNGTGFSGLFAALDTIPPGNPLGLPPSLTDGRFDGLFSVTGGAVRLTVPEPTSMALLGLGIFGLAAARRRKAA